MKSIKCIIPLLLLFVVFTTNAQVSVSLTVRTAPPPLPVYVQPECPADGYIWQPGYWAWDPNDGYYWVPGVWVAPPNPGLYWTPAYWGFVGGVYGFHAGYWGPHVGFYGGINYGYGYSGYGYGGGRWVGNRFSYNTAVVRVNRTVIHNTYIDRTVIRRNTSRASFNGRGGVTARPRPNELAAARERHIAPTSNQAAHQEAARKDRSSFARVNHGRPAITRAAPHATPHTPGHVTAHNTEARRPNVAHNEARAHAATPHNNPGTGAEHHAAARTPRASAPRVAEHHAAPAARAERPHVERAPAARAPVQRAPVQRAPAQRAPAPHAAAAPRGGGGRHH